MPDSQISRLAELPASLLDAEDVLAIVDESASETKKIKATSLVVGTIDDLPDSSIDPGKIDWDTLNIDIINGGVIKDRSIEGVKLKTNTVTALEIAPDAIGSSELADGSVDENAVQDRAISADKIADSAIQSRHYSSGSIGNAPLASGSVDSRVLADNAVDRTAVQDGAISAEKLAADLNGDSILADGSISSALAEDSVGSRELQNAAVANENLQDNSVTDSKLSGGIDGARINNGSLSPLALPESAFSNGVKLDGTIQIDNDITPGTRNGIEYNAQGLIVGTAALDRTDLPIATTSSVGAVSVPGSGGLAVTLTGELSIGNTITPGTSGGITYNQHGLITAVGSVDPTDLPIATNVTLGAVKVPTTDNNPIRLDGEGNVTFRDGVTPGTFVNVTVDQYGLVTTGSDVLLPSQVPGLDASKITSGQFTSTRLADGAVTMPKLADYAISFIQEAQPTISTDMHIGCFWYQESSAQLRMWNGNSFMPVGFGRLSQENLRFGGLVNADTGLVVTLTDAGRTAGLVKGDPVPAATDALGGLYLVASVAGNGITVLPGTAFDAGDWCLCVNKEEGWIRIDTLTGGGGGGGGGYLNDLLDVDIDNVQGGDTLIYDATLGQWTNATTTADRVSISPAFDGSQTSFTLSMEIVDQNNVLMSLGGVILEPQVDFQIVSGTREITFATAPPAGSDYFLINQQTVNASGGGGGTTLPPGTSAEEYLKWNNTLSTWQPASELDGGTF